MGIAMRIEALLVICHGLIGPAHAAPVTLICDGNLTADGKQINIGGETAILDIERTSFKPPLYPEFPLTRVGENDLTFGSELSNLSTW
jgi:hypothetical protein